VKGEIATHADNDVGLRNYDRYSSRHQIPPMNR